MVIVRYHSEWFQSLTVHRPKPFKKKWQIYGGGNEMAEVILSTGIHLAFHVREIFMKTGI